MPGALGEQSNGVSEHRCEQNPQLEEAAATAVDGPGRRYFIFVL